MEPRTFRDIAGRFSTGVTVVTTIGQNGHPVGMTANSFCSLSLNPPLVLFNIDKSASLFEDFMKTDKFAVNILSTSQEDLSRRFSAKDIDRFVGISYDVATTGSPILKDVLGYFDNRVVQRYEGGDHMIVIGEVQDGGLREGNPLIFFQGKYFHL